MIQDVTTHDDEEMKQVASTAASTLPLERRREHEDEATTLTTSSTAASTIFFSASIIRVEDVQQSTSTIKRGLFFCCCLKANKKVEYEGLPRLEKATARQSVSKEVSVTFFFSGFWPNSPVVILDPIKKKNHKTTKKFNGSRLDVLSFLLFIEFTYYSKMVTQIFWLKSNEEDSCARRLQKKP